MFFKTTSPFPHNNVNADGNPANIHLRTSPTVAFFNNQIYLFYVSGERRNIFYATYNVAKAIWSIPENLEPNIVGVGVAVNTSPCAVVFDNILHLFYQGYDENGTWLTTLDSGANAKWSELVSFNKSVKDKGIAQGDFLYQTSPSATVHDKRLYLFWVSPPRIFQPTEGNIHYSSCLADKKWDPPKIIELGSIGSPAPGRPVVRQPTSPCSVSFNGILHVFWNSGTEISYTTMDKKGNWSAKTPGPEAAKTSGTPFAFVQHYVVESSPSSTTSALRLCWPVTNDFCYSSIYEVRGSWDNPVVAMCTQHDLTPSPALNTFPCAISTSSFGLFFFYADSKRTIQIGKSLTYALEKSMDIPEPTKDHLLGRHIVFSSFDKPLALFLQSTMKDHDWSKQDKRTADAIVEKLVFSWNKRTQTDLPTVSLFGTLLYWIAISKGRRVIFDVKAQPPHRVDIYISPF